VRGKLQFGADIDFPGVLHGKVLEVLIPMPSSKGSTRKRPRQYPAWSAVLTAKDVPGRNGFGAIIQISLFSVGTNPIHRDGVPSSQPSPRDCIRALELIEVEYEPLPAVFSPIEAMKSDAPKIHEKGNLNHKQDPKGEQRRDQRG